MHCYCIEYYYCIHVCYYNKSLLRTRSRHCSVFRCYYFKDKVMNPTTEVNNRLSSSQQPWRLRAQVAKIARPKVSRVEVDRAKFDLITIINSQRTIFFPLPFLSSLPLFTIVCVASLV